jgi:hypothetical protein
VQSSHLAAKRRLRGGGRKSPRSSHPGNFDHCRYTPVTEIVPDESACSGATTFTSAPCDPTLGKTTRPLTTQAPSSPCALSVFAVNSPPPATRAPPNSAPPARHSDPPAPPRRPPPRDTRDSPIGSAICRRPASAGRRAGGQYGPRCADPRVNT